MLLVQDNLEDLEMFEDAKEDFEPTELQVVNVKNTVELSMNSVVGLSNSSMMKVRGEVLNHGVVVLIDCGATHNFMAQNCS